MRVDTGDLRGPLVNINSLSRASDERNVFSVSESGRALNAKAPVRGGTGGPRVWRRAAPPCHGTLLAHFAAKIQRNWEQLGEVNLLIEKAMLFVDFSRFLHLADF